MDEGLATLKTSAAERIAAVQQQLGRVDLSTKDADTAFLIELVAAVFGFLGVGHMYAGLTNTGIVRLIANLVFVFAMWSVFGILSTVTCGFGLCLIPLPIILQIIPGYYSAKELKQAMTTVKTRGGGTGNQPYSQPVNPYLNQPSDPYPGADIYEVPPRQESPVQPPRSTDQDQGSNF